MPSIAVSFLSALMVTATLAAPYKVHRGERSHAHAVSRGRRMRLEWSTFSEWFKQTGSDGSVSTSSTFSASPGVASPVVAKAKPKSNVKKVKAAAPIPATVVPTSDSGSSTGTDGDIDAWLKAHNAVRALYSAPNVIWSDKLAKAAQVESDTCVFAHTKNNIYGENIAAGQNSIAVVVDQWVSGPDEKSVYDPANPSYSHFTQVVWKDTTEIGCAKTTCPTIAGLPQANPVFWTCEYNPPGNVIGQFADNVLAAKGGAPL